MKCIICKQEIKPDKYGWAEGHNPAPISNNINHRCCDKCNDTQVIPIRIADMYVHKEDNNE